MRCKFSKNTECLVNNCRFCETYYTLIDNTIYLHCDKDLIKTYEQGCKEQLMVDSEHLKKRLAETHKQGYEAGKRDVIEAVREWSNKRNTTDVAWKFKLETLLADKESGV